MADSPDDRYVAINAKHPLHSIGGEYLDPNGNTLIGIGPIRDINILVGPNNSGKSRLMRALLTAGELHVGPGPFDAWLALRARLAQTTSSTLNSRTVVYGSWGDLSASTAFRPNGNEQFQPPIILNVGLYKSLFVDKPWRTWLSEEDEVLKTRWQIWQKIGAMGQVTDNLYRLFEIDGDHRVRWSEPISGGDAETLNLLGAYLTETPTVDEQAIVSHKRATYMPTLRTSLRLYDEESPIEERLRDLLMLRGSDVVWTGQELYEELDKVLRGTIADRARLAQFETWLSDSFFSSRRVGLVPRRDGHVVLEVDGEDRAIQNLGDGLQQLIILTFPIFMAEEGHVFFIEEPETHMHPGLLRVLIDVLLSSEIRAKKLVTFLTTHSNHLLSAAFDRAEHISLFALRREAVGAASTTRQFTVRHVARADVRLLDDLGVHNSSVFLAQCQIWVEGPSDRLYLRAYLKVLHEADAAASICAEHLLEDRDYAFVMYGGSLLTDDTFEPDSMNGSPFALGSRILLIADRDEGKEAKHESLTRCADASEGKLVYRPLNVREIENTIGDKLLTEALCALYPLLRRKLGDRTIGLPNNKRLVDHLREIGVKSSWDEKTSLARKVTQPLPAFDELTDEARALALELDAFIRAAAGFRAVQREHDSMDSAR